jgi:hypothetical protein
MTKVATPTAATTTIPQQQEEQSSSPSSYSLRRLKLYTLAEIEHCQTSKTIMKYIEAKTIQDKNTGITYKTQMHSLLSSSIDVIIKHRLTSFWSRLKLAEVVGSNPTRSILSFW